MSKQATLKAMPDTRVTPRVREASRIDGMKALESEEAAAGSILTGLAYTLDKKLERAHKGMLPALRSMADNHSWALEAQFIYDVGNAHIVAIGGELMEAFNAVLGGKRRAGSSPYRRVCARAYELWVENLPVMRAREKAAEAHLVGKLTPTMRKHISGIRAVFDHETIARWIVFRRKQMLLQPMPGEPGYTFEIHINALKSAIAEERNKLLVQAEELSDGDDHAHSIQCTAMFDAAMRLVCARNPEIAAAYRENVKPLPGGATRKGRGLRLVSTD